MCQPQLYAIPLHGHSRVRPIAVLVPLVVSHTFAPSTFLAILNAWCPVMRVAPAVRNGHDANDVCVATEDECIWKAPHWKAAMDRIEFLTQGRQLEEYRRKPLYLEEEVIA